MNTSSRVVTAVEVSCLEKQPTGERCDYRSQQLLRKQGLSAFGKECEPDGWTKQTDSLSVYGIDVQPVFRKILPGNEFEHYFEKKPRTVPYGTRLDSYHASKIKARPTRLFEIFWNSSRGLSAEYESTHLFNVCAGKKPEAAKPGAANLVAMLKT